MKHLFSLLFTLFLFVTAQATDTTFVYFQSGESKLSLIEQEKLNQEVSRHNSLVLDSISLTGHTDNTGSLNYNKELSLKRVEVVKNNLSESYSIPILSFAQTDFKQVDNRSEEEKTKERYVQIIWYYSPAKDSSLVLDENTILLQSQQNFKETISSFKPQKTVIPLDPKEEKVIETQNGNLVLIQKETFVREDGSTPQKVNFEVEEYTTPSSFLAAGFRTRTTSGELLETGGMMNLKATDENGDELKMKKSMTLGFKRNKDRADNPGMRLYDGVQTENGVEWKETENPSYKKPFSFDYEKLFMTALDYAGAQNDIALSIVNVTKAVYKSTNKFKSIKDLKGEDKKMIFRAIQNESIHVITEHTSVGTELERYEQKNEQKKQKSNETLQENEYYFTNTTNLGSLNCDAPIFRDGATCFSVDRKVGVNDSEKLYLFFNDANSYMTGNTNESAGSCTFTRVPNNKKATIIGIKAKGDRLYLGMKEIITSEKSQELNYRICTKEELKLKLDGLMQI